jgi:hypothetical protein
MLYPTRSTLEAFTVEVAMALLGFQEIIMSPLHIKESSMHDIDEAAS